eukprot:CAMPEP_0172455772 /NCGR_PEP_ID=MMETSP1065-20121228/12240_1 /TAXON_ID=265537 /ORGANISM="Amphiprora paludosa, Strain CCMP125" /LENGTH=330 /DNA_ID=CAMNT_0013208249 /DNA_START=77 /DNA_END=1069 /DNA_ORIENTATION=+
MAKSGLSRRKGAAARSGDRNIVCILAILAVGVVMILMGSILYLQVTSTDPKQSTREIISQHAANYVAQHPMPKFPEMLRGGAKRNAKAAPEADQERGEMEIDQDEFAEDLGEDPRNLPRDDDFTPSGDQEVDEEDDEDEPTAHLKQQQRQVLVLTTDLGPIRIVLRPDYSAESVKYIQDVVNPNGPSRCDRCNFYRAESKGILQGMITSNSVPVATQKGSCPHGLESVPNNCPEWDKTCGCHGPIMERGYVGWAAGKMGPDFFIDDYRKPAKFWGTQHTVWGQIVDENSLMVIQQIWTKPAKKKNGLTYLDEHIQFQMHIEAEALPSAAV